uniref:uncharacterized protein LOC122583662 n=1 Tax=Erigeron canadensis TaxID=72917 RepID=UPI001CB98CC2|nr:uncharacterized protein LOC122583662 [Erigeron canadensis]
MQEARLIIWDEAPMTQKYASETLDKTLEDILGYKDLRNKHQVFGGMTVLLGGDFRQILSVIPKGKKQEIVHSCINKYVLWKYCRLFTLSRSMQVNEYSSTGVVDIEKQEFNKWVLNIGDGIIEAKAKESEDEPTWIPILEKFIVPYSTSPIEEIIKATFPDFLEN